MEVTLLFALLAGIVSFVSPCCLPLYPAFLSYITGMSVHDIQNQNSADIRRKVMIHTFFFLLGFAVMFYLLGSAAGIFSYYFRVYQDLISKLAAILIILMGLLLLGIFKPQLLMRTKTLQFKRKSVGYFGTFIIGFGFSAGWTPCIGPILTAILALAASQPGSWFPLITAYIIGFSVPFVVMAYFIGSAKWMVKYSQRIMQVGGAIMIVIGVLLYSGQLLRIATWLNVLTPDWLIL